MADTSFAITQGSGTSIDSRTEATNGNHRQVIVIGDPSTNAGVAPVDATTGLKVDLGTDNDVTATGNVAHAATDSGNPVKTGGKARTANPSAVSDGQRVDGAYDDLGRVVTVPHQVRDLITTQTTTISASTSETTVLTAVASTFLDVVLITVANTSATGVRVDFRDDTAGTIRFSLYCPASQTTGFAAPVPIPQTAVNKNWTAQSSGSVTDLRIYMVAAKNV